MKKEEIKDKSIDLLFKIYEAGVEHKTVDLSYELRKLQSLTEQEQPKQSVEHIIRHSTINYLQFMGDFEEWDRNNVINVYQKSNHYYNFLKALKEYTQTQSVVSDEDIEKELSNHVAEWLGDLTEEDKSVIQCCAEWMRNKLNKSE